MVERPTSQGRPLPDVEPTTVTISPKTQNRWAVVVGIGDYAKTGWWTLSTPRNDAQTVHDVLKGDVHYQNQDGLKLFIDNFATRDGILDAVRECSQMASSGDLLLFYFSGHGNLEGTDAVIIPYDYNRNAPKDSSLSISEIVRLFKSSRAKEEIIIVDACHSGPDIPNEGEESKGKQYEFMNRGFMERVFEQARGLAILSSCTANQDSFSYKEKQLSSFTYFLSEGLKGGADFNQRGFITVGNLFQYVADKVGEWSKKNKHEQTPGLQYTTTGEIILIDYRQQQNEEANHFTQLDGANLFFEGDALIAQDKYWGCNDIVNYFINSIGQDHTPLGRVLAIHGSIEESVDLFIDRLEEITKAISTKNPLLYVRVPLHQEIHSPERLVMEILIGLHAQAAYTEHEDTRHLVDRLEQEIDRIEKILGRNRPQTLERELFQLASSLVAFLNELSIHYKLVIFLEGFENVAEDHIGQWLLDEWLTYQAPRVRGLLMVITGDSKLEKLKEIGSIRYFPVGAMSSGEFLDWAQEGFGLKYVSPELAKRLYEQVQGNPRRYLDILMAYKARDQEQSKEN